MNAWKCKTSSYNKVARVKVDLYLMRVYSDIKRVWVLFEFTAHVCLDMF